MGNLGSKTKQENSLEVFKKIATSSNSKISSILVGYMMSVDNAARKEISERIEKNHVDLIEFHSVQTKTPTDMLKMNFSTLALAKRYSDIAKETLQLPSRDRYLREEDHSAMNFNHIYDFLHYGYYRSVNSDDNKKEKLEEIDEEIIDAFTIMKYEVESWRDSPMTTQEEKKYFEEFHKIFDSFENNRKTDWKTVSENLANFINEQVKVLERLSERSVEALMLALSLYVFSSLRKDAVTNGSIEQITNVIDNACAHLQQCFTNLHVDNSEAFFKREKGLYIGIDKLPGVGPVDIFAGLIRGLQSAVIQKLKCERSISVMSIDATTSSVTSNTEDEAENHCIAKGCSKLDLTRPASFKSSDKENNIKFQVDIRVPVFYNLSCNDPNRLWDYRYEIWEFKSLEHSVYFSPLTYRIVTELSAIHSSLEDISKQIGQGTTQISSYSSSTIQTTVTKTNQPSYKDYTKFEKTLRRKVYYLANIERSKDIIVEIQEPWMGMA